MAGTLPPGLHLYIAPIGLGDLNGTKFYGGIQTNIGGNPVCTSSGSGNGDGGGNGGSGDGSEAAASVGDAAEVSAEDPHNRNQEEQATYHSGVHGAIFSRWSTRSTPVVDLSFVRPAADGLVESAGYEGDFVSGRRSVKLPRPPRAFSQLKRTLMGCATAPPMTLVCGTTHH